MGRDCDGQGLCLAFAAGGGNLVDQYRTRGVDSGNAYMLVAVMRIIARPLNRWYFQPKGKGLSVSRKIHRNSAISGVLSVLLVIGALLTAAPANAVTPTNININCFNEAAGSTITGAVGETFTIENITATNCPTMNKNGVVSGVTRIPILVSPGTPPNHSITLTIVKSGTFTVELGSTPSRNLTFTVVATAAPVSAATPVQLPAVIQTIVFGFGLSNSAAPVTGPHSSWTSVPEATSSDGEPVVNKASGQMLCGFATNSDFSPSIAGRQVTNGWGAYEVWDAGRITAVFIPVGGFIQLNGPNTLFPIWCPSGETSSL